MSRIIKQSYVALKQEKKIIQSAGEFRTMEPRALEKTETVAARVIQEVAADILEQEMSKASPMQSEVPAEPDFSRYEEEAAKIIADAEAGKGRIYEQTYRSAMEEAGEELARRTAALEKEYQTKKAKLEEEMKAKCQTTIDQEMHLLEGKMILWMKGMLEKLVGQASQNQNVLTHLIRMGMQEISLQGDLIIRVSEQDLDFVLQNKSKLTEELSEKLTIEVLKDKNLQKNQCIIETIMGNIECSLDVQLKGITDELTLIYESIMKNVHNS